MTELWIDFRTRRIRFKNALHDALGWDSRRFDSLRLDIVMTRKDFRSIVGLVRQMGVERWNGSPDGMPPQSPTTSRYVRMTAGKRVVERFAAGTSDPLQTIFRFALAHKRLYGDVAESVSVAAYDASDDACQESL